MLRQLVSILEKLIDQIPTFAQLAIVISLIIIAIIIPNLDKITNAYSKIKNAIEKWSKIEKVGELEKNLQELRDSIIMKTSERKQNIKNIEEIIKSIEEKINDNAFQQNSAKNIQDEIKRLKLQVENLKNISEFNDIEQLSVLQVDNKERANRMTKKVQ